MMKFKNLLLYIIMILLAFQVKAQKVVTDTIYLAKNFNSYITIGKEIKKINYGSNVFAVSGQGLPEFLNHRSIVTIKAKKRFRETTNVTAITNDFTYYNIICLYTDKQPKNVFHFYDIPKTKEEITQEIVNSDEGENKDVFVKEAKEEEDKEALFQENFFVDTIYYKAQAKKINTHHKLYDTYKRRFVNQENMSFGLVGTWARKDKIYVKVQIRNYSPLPFDISGFTFHTAKDNGGWDKETTPESEIFPIYEYNTKFQSVLPERSMYRTFVFNNFSIARGKSFVIKILEKNSERKILLPVSSKFINSPKPLQKKWDQKTLDLIKEKEEQTKKEKKKKSSKEDKTSNEDSVTTIK